MWVLVFWAGVGYFGALSINQFVRLSLRNLDLPVHQTKFSGGLDLSSSLDATKILNNHNLLDPKSSPVEEKEQPKPKDSEVKPKEPEPSNTERDQYGCLPIIPGREIPETKIQRIRLMGTSYVDAEPQQSIAAIYVQAQELIKQPPLKDPKQKPPPPSYRTVWKIELFRVGDVAMQARICAIGPREVILMHNNQLEILLLYSKKKHPKGTYYGAFGFKPKEEDKDGPGQVKAESTDEFTISRATVQNWLANPMQHAMSARIMPHSENGKPAGIRLVWVRDKSLYSQIGLQSGDIVQEINGKTLNVSNALGLYSQLPHAKALQINVIRKGARRSLVYNIK